MGLRDPVRGGAEDRLTQKFVSADDGVRLHIVQEGRGPVLALAHGGPGFWDYLEPLGSDLSRIATVVRYDQRGNGRSDHVGPYTLARFVADFDAVREAAGIDRWVAGGHSFGAGLALLYALDHPEHTSGLLYIAGVGVEWPRWREQRERETRRRLARLPGDLVGDARVWTTDYASPRSARPEVDRMLASGYSVNLTANRRIDREMWATPPERLLDRCRGLQCPVLVIQGQRDPRPLAAADSLVEALPTVKRVVLKGAGHFPWVERPDAFLAAVRGWLSGLGQPGRGV